MFAEGLITSCCQKAGVAPADLNRNNLPQVLVEVEKAVRTFRPEAADSLIADLRKLNS